MGTIEVSLTALGLAMDCFAVSIACGLVMKKFQFLPAFRIAFLFGLFQALMPLLGWLLGTQFEKYIRHLDHWIAFALLAFLGGRMIYVDICKRKKKTIPKLINPYKNRVVLSLAVATSIDALAVGLSFSLLEISLCQTVLIIGLVSFVLSWLGILLALRYGNRFRIRAELIGGIILIAIGSKILMEHLIMHSLQG
ncbi:MAG: manganese efflux pump MntP family protein [Bacteroidales bacterium]